MNEEEKSESDQTVSEAKTDDTKIKKVAIYSRIPTSGDWTPDAAEKEINCLKEKIQKKEHWELCKIYTDRGLSRKSRGCYRVELKKMLRDAKNREIDLIVCPTFARFGRNIGETIDISLRLKRDDPEHPVGIYFDFERYFTLDYYPMLDDEYLPIALFGWNPAKDSNRKSIWEDEPDNTSK